MIKTSEIKRDAATIARDTALAQLRTAIVVLRNAPDSVEQIAALKIHIERLLSAPEELLWVDYILPSTDFAHGKPIKAKDQLPIIKNSLSLIGIDLDILYVNEPEEKSWVLSWSKGKKARLFWTKASEWNVRLFLAHNDNYVCTGFDLYDYLDQVGVDRTWWSRDWD